MYAAETKDAWREYAIANDIARAVQTDDGLLLVYNPGFHADHIGEIPPDTRWHVNLRVERTAVGNEFVKQKKYKPLSATGVSWIEPETVTTPQRIWLGGMTYFSENIPEDALVNRFPPVLDQETASLGDLVQVATPGVWLGTPELVTYQWLRDGVEINQAITPNHTVNLLDVGHSLECRETAKNATSERSVLSNACVVS